MAPSGDSALPARARYLLVVAGTATLLAAGIAAVAPPEKTLGAVYRLVLFHGALAIVAIGMLALAGVAGLLSVGLERFEPGTAAARVAAAATGGGLETGALTFALYFASAVASMQQAWGGVGWGEPRFVAAAAALFIGGILFLAALGIDKRWARSLAAIVTAAVAVPLLTAVPLSFHPASPVTGGGAAPGVALYFVGIVACLAAAVLALWTHRTFAWLAHHLPEEA
jgi:hypothetical protein